MPDARVIDDRWVPSSEAEIQGAIDNGVLVERHYFDVKREVANTPAARKESARDMASFAINGGALLIGVEELKAERTWRLAPQPLDGLGERLELIAHQAVDPPLFVMTRDIPAAVGDGTGYLLVLVPPSGSAPHMVDGTYFGRGDKTRTRLSSADVVRLHSTRRPLEQLAERALDEEIARDYVPVERRQHGHFFGVAGPVSARHDAALHLLQRESTALFDLFLSAEGSVPPSIREVAPQPNSASTFTRRAQGAAMVSWAATGPGRTPRPDASGSSLLDLELREDGGVRVMASRLTADWRRLDAPLTVIAEGVAVAYAIRLARWAGEVGARSGYRGQWVLGVHGDRLRGLASYRWLEQFEPGAPYDADFYRQVTTASHEELTEQPQVVANRLVGRLLRGLGVERAYSSMLSAPGSGETT